MQTPGVWNVNNQSTVSAVRVLWLMVFDVNDQNQSSWLGVKSRVLCDTHYNEPKTLSEIVHL